MNTMTKFFIFCIIFSTQLLAENNHTQMHHQQMMQSKSNLTQAGNDIFATIQEVIVKLDNNPDTDWHKVNIEALRQHLLDMNDMAIHVEVINQKVLKNGLEVVVRPLTIRAETTLERVFKAHPYHLGRGTGWDMQVVRKGKQFIVTTITEKTEDVAKIVALSYIGLMAYGNHHQPHHWAISTKQNPHNQHH